MSSWVVAGIILTGAWTQLDELGWAGWLPLAAVAILERAATFRFAPPGPRQPMSLAPLLSAALLCALLLAHVGLTAREEFGFGGDEGYHLSATRAFALYYLRAGPLLALVVLVFAVWRWKRWPFAATAAMAGLTVASFALPAEPLFGRYPTGTYHLVLPLAVLFEAAGIPYPFTANHIVNVLSVPVWLFVLRPWMLGRWPDWQVLPVALLVYFQPLALVYAGSALLEPWAFVFLLLALEALVALNREEVWLAVPLAASAIVFKESAILLLPTVWIVAAIDWRGGRPQLRRGAIALGAACVLPFLVYYAVRRGQQIERTFELAAASEIWTRARLGEWFANVLAQVGWGGVIATTFTIAVTIRQWWWLVTALAIALFFFADAASVPYTGYGRFVAYAVLAVCGGLFAVAYEWRSRPALLIGASLLIAALHVVPVARVFALDFEPDYMRNSLEWKHALVRLPIRALAARIGEARDSDQVRRVRVIAFGPELISVPVAYPDLAAQFTLTLDQQHGGAVDCTCRDNAEAVLAGFEWPAHFGNTAADRAMFTNVSAACVAQINTTCSTTILEQHPSGAVVGALGVGRLVLIALPQHDERPQR